MASLEELTDRLRRAAAAGADLGASVTLDLKGDGFIHMDGPTVVNEDRPADLTLRITAADLAALGKGDLDPARAMMTGRLKVSDMGLAMRLQPKIRALMASAA